MVNFLANGIGKMLVPKIVKKVTNNPAIIQLLKSHGIDLTKNPNDDFDCIYTCALVHYIQESDKLVHYIQESDKADELVKLFSKPEIKEAFKVGFYDNNDSSVISKIENTVNWNFKDWNTLGEKLSQLNLNFSQELDSFKQIFFDYTNRSQTPSQRLNSQKIDKLLELVESTCSKEVKNKEIDLTPYPDEFKSLIEEKIRLFQGREFVFNAFKKFCQEKTNGYFTIVGDAGMGKRTMKWN